MGQHDFGQSANLRFRWLSCGRIPLEFDLRRCGWTLEDKHEPSIGSIGMVLVDGVDNMGWMQILGSLREEARRLVLLVGVEGAEQRAALLRFGFGDVVGRDADLNELSARATRVEQFATWLPRQRHMGELRLDLLARETYVEGKPLNLNPREFALLWRLSDTPNQTVSKQALIQDVWRMGFVPETNSIAVHMSRLRRKLGFAGLDGMIETATPGGYRLAVSQEQHMHLAEGGTLPLAFPQEVVTPAALRNWKR